jgi:hypothetical protein
MYELRQQVCLLFKESTEKIYAKTTAQVTISTTESIPDPGSQDITVTPNSSGGKDIEIDLRVLGSPSVQTQDVTKEVEVEIIDAGEPLDKEGVIRAVGSKEYDITAKVYKGESLENEDEKKVDKNSKVILE